MRYSLLLITFVSIVCFGQDNHYWTDQFGIQGANLGGAVTAGIDEQSMVYYNPATMYLVKEPSLSVTLNAYQYRTYKNYNALGLNQNLSGSDFSTLPNMIAGILSPSKHPKVRFGYNVLSKNDVTNSLNLLQSQRIDAVQSTAGLENFVGSFNYFMHSSEYWAGIGLGLELSKHISIGLSHFGIYRSMKYSNTYDFRALPEDYTTGDVTSLSSNIAFNYYTVKGLFKPGLSLHFNRFRAGLVYTTPTFHIFGKGSFYREFSIINMDDAITSDVSWIQRENGVKVKHQQNGSLAYGLSFGLSKSVWLHLTGETFLAQKYYLIYDAQKSPNVYPNYIADSTTKKFFGDQAFLSYGEERKMVTNLGFGMSIQMGERAELQFGIRTDVNNNPSARYLFKKQVVESTEYDRLIYSIGGSILSKKGRKFSVAFEYGFAIHKETYYVVDFNSPSANDNALVGKAGMGAYTKANSFRLMFGIYLKQKTESSNTIKPE
ncbi:MAG: hypothetical protein IT221_14325 [Fluviicola sp.]|nr:hypothetical protein [Fluviicola sp.]